MVVSKQGKLLRCFIHCIQSITNTGFALIIGMVKNFEIQVLISRHYIQFSACTLWQTYEELKHFNRSGKTWKDKQPSKLQTLVCREYLTFVLVYCTMLEYCMIIFYLFLYFNKHWKFSMCCQDFCRSCINCSYSEFPIQGFSRGH